MIGKTNNYKELDGGKHLEGEQTRISGLLWDNSLIVGLSDASAEVLMEFLNSRTRVFVMLLAVMVLCGAAFASPSRERTQFGHDVTIGVGEESGEVTCLGCGVHVRGKVNGDVTTIGGSIVVEDRGEISGDTTAIGGNIRLENSAKIGGDATVLGGRLYRDASAAVGGDISSFTGSVWLFVIFGLPFILLGALIALIIWVVRKFTRPTVPAAA